MEKINLTGVSGWTDKKSCWTMKQSKPPLPGEKWATEKVLAHYADYIDELSTVEIRQPGGKVKKVIDEDMRQHISLKLLEALPSFPLEQE